MRLAAILLCLAPVADAQRTPTRDSLLVSTAWLASHLGDANLVVLQVGDRADYDKAHLPGARPVSLDDIAVSDRTGAGLTLELPATRPTPRCAHEARRLG